MLVESVAGALRDAALALADLSDTPRLDAELLMAHALDMERGAMLLNARDLPVPEGFVPLLARRMAHEPVAYIVGSRDFWDMTLAVSLAVLIPRADSECLIEAARDRLRAGPPRRILDLGTGSGALLLAALRLFPDATGVGMDASEAALEVARGNATANGLADRAEFILSDWRTSGWAERLDCPFDLILANPPYVETGALLDPQVARYEPHGALFAGADGLNDYRIILPALLDLLNDGGTAIVEIGAGQADAVTALVPAGWMAEPIRDLGGHVRGLVLRAA